MDVKFSSVYGIYSFLNETCFYVKSFWIIQFFHCEIDISWAYYLQIIF